MRIDLTCPVELWQYAMPTGTDTECTFVMNNLSDKVVTSVQVTLNCFDVNDELLFRQTERVQGLKAGVGERFTVMVLPAEWNGVEGVDLVIEKVWFDDATIWRRGNAPLTYYTPNTLAPGRALDELRFVAGKDAAGFPQRQDAVWICVCGRANALDSDRCCRCERRRDAVFASFSRENVNHVIAAHEKKLAETARKAREENSLLQENQEKQRAARRRHRQMAIRWAGTLVLLGAAAVIVALWGVPTVKYNTALDLLHNGRYDQASAAFSEMGDYRDAKSQVLECSYQKAAALCKLGDTESLEQAEALFLALADYSDSAERAKETGYNLGNRYLTAGNHERAVDAFQRLGDYLDSAEKVNESIYRQAGSMLETDNLEAARVLFAGLGDYDDAAQKVNECTYRMAQQQISAQDYQAALSLLQPLGEYEDSSTLMGQCYYALAQEALTGGDPETAGERFVLAGSYSDAPERANECLYQLAQEKREAGEYEKAMELFLRIPNDENSVQMARQCVYDQAVQLMEGGDLANAAALFESITEFGNVMEKLDQCRFELAQQALENGDARQAERLLEAIAEYKGLDTQLKKVRYQVAQEAMDQGDYQAALDRYLLLDGYKDSSAKAKQCRYALANATMEAGRYEQAADMYAQLGNYKESKTRIKQCRYAIAVSALQAGELNQAISLLQDLGSFEDSKAMLAQAQYRQALQLRENGDLPGAAALFLAAGDYQDAAEQSESCYNEYYGQVAQKARELSQAQDYAGVIATLRDFEMTALSKTYHDLPQLFAGACLQIGDQLYAQGRLYEALPYYQHAGAQDKLNRRAYLILGQWESATGKTATFRADGTCDLMGEALYFRVSNFSLYTGTDPDSLTITHKISVLDQTGMSLRDQRDGQDVLYKLSRPNGFEMPEMELPETVAEEEPAPEPAVQPSQEPVATPDPETADEMLVTEEDDAPNA